VSPGTTTSYAVLVTDVNSCSASTSTSITVYQPPVSDAGPDKGICQGQTTQLNGNNSSSGYTISWSPSTYLDNTNILSPTVIGAPMGSYTYILTLTPSATSVCPPSYDTVNVTVAPSPTVTAMVDSPNVIAGAEVHLSSVGTGVKYSWFPVTGLSCATCENTSVTPLHTTQYVVTTVDSFGCRTSDTVLVNVEDVITLYVPNAFTPYYADNIKGRNPMFYAYGIGVHDFDFYIFTRWGEKIFESHDIYKGWDGSYKGDMVSDDTYVWVVKGRSITGKSISRTGTVTIVR
jgi:hypothetical protein